jgi:hypothetical protein
MGDSLLLRATAGLFPFLLFGVPLIEPLPADVRLDRCLAKDLQHATSVRSN